MARMCHPVLIAGCVLAALGYLFGAPFAAPASPKQRPVETAGSEAPMIAFVAANDEALNGITDSEPLSRTRISPLASSSGAPAAGGSKRCRGTVVRLATKGMGRPVDNSSAECCKSLHKDRDNGLTLRHLLNSLYCTRVSHRRMRVLQVGANTGDNKNDHLVHFLKSSVADAVLLEPVPWIFKKLEHTYERHRSYVNLVQAAMSEKDGNVSFHAPDARISTGKNIQKGAIHLPRGTMNEMKQRLVAKNQFIPITVQSMTFMRVLSLAGWSSGGENAFPKTPMIDAFVVDAEGYDGIIMGMVLDSMEKRGVDPIPVMQYEMKHMRVGDLKVLRRRLQRLGYCVNHVYNDDIAVMPHVRNGRECTASFEIG